MNIDRRRLRIELARRELVQRDLAVLLGVAPTTLSGWLTGASRIPEGLPERIELALKLDHGSLAKIR